MKLVDVLVEEYRRIDEVVMWSEAQKSAARSAVRGVAVSSGLYRSFSDALEEPDSVARFGAQAPFFFDERQYSAV